MIENFSNGCGSGTEIRYSELMPDIPKDQVGRIERSNYPGNGKTGATGKKETGIWKMITLCVPCSSGAGSGNRTCGSWLRESRCVRYSACIFSR
jgi:hypothetical protein